MKITLALCCVAAIAGTADASLWVEEIKVWEGLRELEITIDGTSLPSPAAYSVRSGDDIRVTASRVRSPSTDIAFVIEAGDPALADAIDWLDLARFDVEPSRVIVVTYGGGTETVSIARPGALRPSNLVVAPRGEPGDLIAGIERAVDELEAPISDRKILIVVGRGHVDQASERTLARLDSRISLLGIRAVAVAREPVPITGGLARVVPMTNVAKDNLTTKLREVIDGFEARRIVTFPEVDAEGDRLQWDGLGHSLIITVGAAEVLPYETPVLPARITTCCHADSNPWWWAALAGGLAILVAWAWARRATHVE